LSFSLGDRLVTATNKPAWLGVAPAVFITLWSGGITAAKVAMVDSEPFTFMALRYAITLAVLGLAFIILRPALPKTPRDWLHLAVVGFLLQVLYFGACFVAFENGLSAGAAALIQAQQPILVAILAPWLAGERVDGRRWLGLALGLTGAVLVILARFEIGPDKPLALAVMVFATLAITGATLYEKRFGTPHHPVTNNLVQYVVGLACVLPLAFAFETMAIHWTTGFSLALAYLVIGNSIIAISLLVAMIRHGDASKVSALFFLMPAISALIAWVVLGEPMPPLAWPGLAIAGLGVWLATRPVAPRA
jgi:drug/metabolite transporter (DMT)-like permease